MTFVDRVAQERWELERLSPWAMKSAQSKGRRYTELEHPLRTCFQRDRDRVIHTSSFRRLEYKTQVFVNHEGDNYRTRLTHSLEGAQIGRTAARILALNEELVEALVLGHDLGHTPFGHAGERVMADLMKDHGGFEHNRQTLRVLETLEPMPPASPCFLNFARCATYCVGLTSAIQRAACMLDCELGLASCVIDVLSPIGGGISRLPGRGMPTFP